MKEEPTNKIEYKKVFKMNTQRNKKIKKKQKR